MSEKHENPGSHIQPASSPVARRISLAPTATKSSTAALWDSSPRVPSSRDADEALEFLENHPRAAELLEEARTILADPVRSRKLTRKIDWVVLPSLIVTYFLQYLDKMTLPYTSVMGIIGDIHLVNQQYNHVNMLFYIGFLACELFSLYLAQRISRLGVYLSGNIVLWGISLTCHAAVQNFAQLAVLRTLLGAFESCVSPILVLIVVMWYRKQDQGRRVSWFYVANSMAVVCGGFVAYGVSLAQSSLAVWRIFFLAAGLCTILVGVVVGMRLPDSPVRTKRFTDAEKMAILLRVKENQSGTQNARFKKEQVYEAMADLRVWLVALCALLGAIPNGAVTAFCSMLIVSFGFQARTALLLTTPAGLLGALTVLLCGYLSDRWRDRSTVMLIAVTPAMVSAGLFYGFSGANGVVTNKGGLLAATVMFGTLGASFMLLLAWNASNIAGHSKKIFAGCLTMVAFCLGNIIGTQCFLSHEAPGYVTGKIIICVSLALFYPVVWGLRLYNDWLNAHKAKVLARMPEAQKQELIDQLAFADVTDRHNPFFVYTH